MKAKRMRLWSGAALLAGLLLLLFYVSQIRLSQDVSVRVRTPVPGVRFGISAVTPLGRAVPMLPGIVYNGNFSRVRLRCSKGLEPVLKASVITLTSGGKSAEVQGGQLILEKEGRDYKRFRIPDHLPYALSAGEKMTALGRAMLSAAFWLRGFALLLLLVLAGWMLRRMLRKIRKDQISIRRLLRRMAGRFAVFAAGTALALILLLILAEILLRAGGAMYRNELKIQSKKPGEKIRILCVGDSFTRGIGASPGMSYPEQLQRLCDSVAPGKAEVISIGEAGQNSAQILERLEKTLAKTRPDVAVMLFGMANSWNYQGFSTGNSLLYRFRAYRLIKRIIANLSYNSQMTGVEKLRQKRAALVFEEAAVRMAQNPSDAQAFQLMGEHHMILLEFGHAILCFSRAAELDTTSAQSLLGLQHAFPRLELELFYSDGDGHHKGNLYPAWLREMHRKHPHNQRYPALLAAQGFDEGETEEGLRWLETAIATDTGDFGSCYLPLHYLKDSVSTVMLDNFFRSMDKRRRISPKHAEVVRALLMLRLRRYDEALALCRSALQRDSSLGCALAAKAAVLLERGDPSAADCLLKGIRSSGDPELFHDLSAALCLKEGDTMAACFHIRKSLHRHPGGQTALSLALRSRRLPDYAARELRRFFTYRSQYDKFTGTEHRFFLEPLLDYRYYFFRDLRIRYFQPLAERRTMNLSDSAVFGWIRHDIRESVKLCRSHGAAVICMNYPLIPPPNSDEISYWAYHTGNIWKQTAAEMQLPFVNHDSLFSLKGQETENFFEPRRGGTEHCNDKGYGLMAANILGILLKREYLKPDAKPGQH